MTTTIPEDLAALGIHLKPVHGPRAVTSLISVVIPADSAPEIEVVATAASLLASACQDFTVDIVGASESATSRARAWLSPDARFHWMPDSGGMPMASRFTLVLHAGTRIGTFSLEALVDVALSTGAALVRVLVDGRTSAAEFWVTSVLAEHRASGDPERAVRAGGSERWISSSSVGLHDYLRPAPRLHLRKGSAGRHELTIVVRDAADPDVRADYEDRIRHLEARLVRSEAARRRLEAGLLPERGVARLAAAARRGPGYVTARAATILGRRRGR